MQIDDYGRVILTEDDMIEVMFAGGDLANVFAENSPAFQQYNALCRDNDKSDATIGYAEPLPYTPEEMHKERQKTWFVPLSVQEIDVWAYLKPRCKNAEEQDRLEAERIEFEKRDLLPLLRLMIYLVDDFRRRKVVWGVGRGSSVASFTLFLIGITKINPIQYGLEITDFLR